MNNSVGNTMTKATSWHRSGWYGHGWFVPCSLAWLLLLTVLPGTAAGQVQVQRQDAIQMWVLRGQTADAYRDTLIAQAEHSLQDIKRILSEGAHALTPEQEAKLELAVKGVGSRFKQDITQLYGTVGFINVNDVNEQRKALQVLQPAMQRAQQGWYGKELFDKAVEKTLEVDQRELMNERRRLQAEQLDHAIALRVVATLDARLGMTKAQREKLVELIDQQKLNRVPENLQSFAIYVRILRIPDKELDGFLDQQQKTQLKETLEPYRQWERSIR